MPLQQSDYIEEPFFFYSGKKRIFAVLHQPNKEFSKNGLALIFCTAFAEEKLWAHRVFVSFARDLAKEGIAVLRFDFMGHGDSEGEFEDSNVETQLRDIQSAIELVKIKTRSKTIGLLGLRLGATLAAIAARQSAFIDFLVLWEPIIKCKDYLQKCLRSNLAKQMAIYKKIIHDRKKLTEELLNGRHVNIDGYLMSGSFYKQASAIDLNSFAPPFLLPQQLVHISKKPNAPIKKDILTYYKNQIENANSINQLSQVCEDHFWTEINSYYQRANALFESTKSWICKHFNQG